MPAQSEPIIQIIRKHKKEPGKLLEILQDISQEYNHVSAEMMKIIAEELHISAAKVYGTATFYSFINTEEKGKYTIRICKTISCEMQGKSSVLKVISEKLQITLGQTTIDKKITLEETNCLGFCHKGPAMLVNNDIYTELTPQKAISIIENLE